MAVCFAFQADFNVVFIKFVEMLITLTTLLKINVLDMLKNVDISEEP